jgi:hypothetical protein
MVDSNNDIGLSVMNSEDNDEDEDGNDGEDDERFSARRILLECTAVVVAGNARMLTGKTDTATVVAIATMLRRDFIFVVDEI